jgi:hypothetical protein
LRVSGAYVERQTIQLPTEQGQNQKQPEPKKRLHRK